MAIFNSYVKLPEGMFCEACDDGDGLGHGKTNKFQG